MALPELDLPPKISPISFRCALLVNVSSVLTGWVIGVVEVEASTKVFTALVSDVPKASTSIGSSWVALTIALSFPLVVSSLVVAPIDVLMLSLVPMLGLLLLLLVVLFVGGGASLSSSESLLDKRLELELLLETERLSKEALDLPSRNRVGVGGGVGGELSLLTVFVEAGGLSELLLVELFSTASFTRLLFESELVVVFVFVIVARFRLED